MTLGTWPWHGKHGALNFYCTMVGLTTAIGDFSVDSTNFPRPTCAPPRYTFVPVTSKPKSLELVWKYLIHVQGLDKVWISVQATMRHISRSSKYSSTHIDFKTQTMVKAIDNPLSKSLIALGELFCFRSSPNTPYFGDPSIYLSISALCPRCVCINVEAHVRTLCLGSSPYLTVW